MPLTLDKQKALETYELMKLIRLFEEECASQYMRGLIRGFLHLYIGEEAVADARDRQRRRLVSRALRLLLGLPRGRMARRRR